MRLFVALALPEQELLAIASWRNASYGDRPEFRLPRADTLHVTLAFLGQRDEQDLERIAELATDDLPAKPFELTVERVVGVPSNRPRLHALELSDGDERLANWQSVLSRRLEEAGLYTPERRTFWPHLTVARGRRGHEREVAKASLPQLPPRLHRRFDARTVTLFSSTLHPRGATYERIAQAQTG